MEASHNKAFHRTGNNLVCFFNGGFPAAEFYRYVYNNKGDKWKS